MNEEDDSEGELYHLCEKFNGKPMTYAANRTNSASYVSCEPPMRAIEKKVGILRRIFDAILNAMHESRRRQAEREIANFVALQGGRVTDDLEREMTRRLFKTGTLANKKDGTSEGPSLTSPLGGVVVTWRRGNGSKSTNLKLSGRRGKDEFRRTE